MGVDDPDEMEALESDALDALYAGDDSEAAPGTVPLSEARRKREQANVVGLFGAGGTPVRPWHPAGSAS